MGAAELAVNGMKPDDANVVGWIDFGDLHLTTADQQNYTDLQQLIEEANHYLRDQLQFAVLPGDNAEHGTASEYALVRRAVDMLRMPLFAIAGDHDLHSGSLDLFRRYLAPHPHYAFSLSGHRLLFLNTMEAGTHKAFAHSGEQLAWARVELESATRVNEECVIFMHYYPSEVATGGGELSALIDEFGVRLVEIGHTHYNELANDGTTIYAATRSTGQIEEGPVGFSITIFDRGVMSWKFHPLGVWPFAMITAPGEAALDTSHRPHPKAESLLVRARCWGDDAVESGLATLGVDGSCTAAMRWNEKDNVWTAEFETSDLKSGMYRLRVDFRLVGGTAATDWIEIRLGEEISLKTATSGFPVSGKDKDFVIQAQPDKGLLGTELGPNKNGHKW